MAYTADALIQMFTNRKQLKWIAPSGSAWAQRNGTEAAQFWITQKQADWVLGVYGKTNNYPTTPKDAGGIITVDGVEVKWQLHQMSKRSSNGAGIVTLAR